MESEQAYFMHYGTAKYVIYHSICLVLLLWYLKLEDYEWARVGQTGNAHKILVAMEIQI